MNPDNTPKDISVKATIKIVINDQSFELSRTDAENLHHQLSFALGKSVFPPYLYPYPWVAYNDNKTTPSYPNTVIYGNGTATTGLTGGHTVGVQTYGTINNNSGIVNRTQEA